MHCGIVYIVIKAEVTMKKVINIKNFFLQEYISLKLLLAASENFSNDNLQSAASPIIHHTHS